MEILEKSFVEWWKGLSSTEKDDVAIALSRECNTALATVTAWGLGYRTPKARSQELIANYLKSARNIETECSTLFPN